MIVYKNLLLENCDLQLVLSKKNKPQEIQELSEYQNAFNIYKLLFVSQNGLVLNEVKGTLKDITKKVFNSLQDTIRINGFEYNLKGVKSTGKQDLYATLLELVEPLSDKENFAKYIKLECIDTLDYVAYCSELEIKEG